MEKVLKLSCVMLKAVYPELNTNLYTTLSEQHGTPHERVEVVRRAVRIAQQRCQAIVMQGCDNICLTIILTQ